MTLCPQDIPVSRDAQHSIHLALGLGPGSADERATRRKNLMTQIIYIVGAIVVVIAVLSFAGLA